MATRNLARRGTHVLGVILIEAWPVAVVVFAGLAALGHVVSTGWEDLLLYNSDSVVLALVELSIQRGEPFQWVFSSQIFLFPESVFFFLSTLFADNPRVAFAVNACLNLVALYALLRAAAHILSRHSRHRFVEITIALGSTLLFVIFVLLEPFASRNLSGIATPFLLTTYYYGVVLSGLGVVVLVLWVTRSFSGQQIERRRMAIYASAVVAITALVGFSNPLFVFEVIAPLWLTLLTLVFMTRMDWRMFGISVGSTLVGLVIAMGLRTLFHGLFASDVSRYLSLSRIPDSIRVLYATLLELLSSPEGALRLFIIGPILLVNFGILAYALYAQGRPPLAARISTAEVFIVVFVGVSAISLIGGMVATGSTTTRYLQPLFIYPLLTCVVLGVYILRRLMAEVESADLRRNLAHFVIGIAVVASSLVVVFGAIGLGSVSRALSDDFTRSECLDDFVGASDANGVASFWTARPLQLYGDHSGQLLQVQADLTIYPWMINLASYDQDEFSYVVFDGNPPVTLEGVFGLLGQPRAIITCEGYDILDYAGTSGERILTDTIRDSLLEGREEHGY